MATGLQVNAKLDGMLIKRGVLDSTKLFTVGAKFKGSIRSIDDTDLLVYYKFNDDTQNVEVINHSNSVDRLVGGSVNPSSPEPTGRGGTATRTGSPCGFVGACGGGMVMGRPSVPNSPFDKSVTYPNDGGSTNRSFAVDKEGEFTEHLQYFNWQVGTTQSIGYNTSKTPGVSTTNIWVKPYVGHQAGTIIGSVSTGSPSEQIGVAIEIDTNDQWNFIVRLAQELNDSSPKQTIKSGEWNMITIRQNHNGTPAYEYILNGDIENKVTSSKLANLGTFSTQQTNHAMLIGNRGTSNLSFEGELDEMSVWNRLLTDEEISRLYNNGVGQPVYSQGVFTVGTATLVKIPQANFIVDGITKGTNTEEFEINALLSSEKTKEFLVNAITGNIVFNDFTTNAILVFRKAVNSAIADALISGSVNEPFSVNAILEKSQTKTFKADALVFTATQKPFCVGAFFLQTNTKDFVIDGLPKTEDSVIFNADGLTKGEQILTFSANAKIVDSNQKLIFVDGTISPVRTKTFSADGVTSIPVPQSILSVESVIGHKTGLQS